MNALRALLHSTLGGGVSGSRRVRLLASLSRRIPLQPLDVRYLYFLEHDGIPAPSRRESPLRAPAEVSFRFACPEEVAALAHFRGVPEAVLLKRFKQGDRCTVATMRNQVAGFAWTSISPDRALERYPYSFAMPADSLYYYDVFVDSDFRRVGIWHRLITVSIASQMRELGRRKLVTIVDFDNTASLAAHLKLGFRLQRSLLVTRILQRHFFHESVCSDQSAGTCALAANTTFSTTA